MYRQGREALNRPYVGRDQMDGHRLVQNLSLIQKQMVPIARAVRPERNLLILGGPTAFLGNIETGKLFWIIKHLHEAESVTILFISHQLNEILEVYKNYTVV